MLTPPPGVPNGRRLQRTFCHHSIFGFTDVCRCRISISHKSKKKNSLVALVLHVAALLGHQRLAHAEGDGRLVQRLVGADGHADLVAHAQQQQPPLGADDGGLYTNDDDDDECFAFAHIAFLGRFFRYLPIFIYAEPGLLQWFEYFGRFGFGCLIKRECV